MAPAQYEFAMLEGSSVQIWRPIFAHEQLPAKFPKHIRRPIVQFGVAKSGSLFLPSAADNSINPGEIQEFNQFEQNDHGSTPGPSHNDLGCGDFLAPHVQFKTVRIVGGRAAVPKKVTADLDSEDETIWRMKESGESNEIIANLLIERGGTRYDPKTISTRHARIRAALNDAEETRRDDEFSDYHEDEDCVLIQAFEKTNTSYQQRLQALQDTRWKEVSELVQQALGKNKYSFRACRTRVETLYDGTAIIPQEYDTDPSERAKLAAECIDERLRTKAAAREKIRQEEAEKLRIKQEEEAIKEAERRHRAQKHARAQAKKEAAAAEREAALEAKQLERERIAAEKEAEAKAKRDAKEKAEREKDDAKAARAYKREMRKETREAKLLREELEKVERARQAKMARLRELQDYGKAREIIRRTMRSAGIAANAPLTKPKVLPTTKTTKGLSKRAATIDSDDDEFVTAPCKRKRNSSIPKTSAAKGKDVASPTSANDSPRFRMTTNGLMDLLRTRGLRLAGRKQELLDRLAEDDGKKTTKELKAELAERQLRTTGTKIELLRRLADHDALADVGY